MRKLLWAFAFALASAGASAHTDAGRRDDSSIYPTPASSLIWNAVFGGEPDLPDTGAPLPGDATQAYRYTMEWMHKAMDADSGNPNYVFARNMAAHHQGAVDMARVEMQHGRDPRMRALAGYIYTIQRQEIALMNAWLHRAGRPTADGGAYIAEYGQARDAMHHAMMIDYSGDPDVDFVRGMIPHHQGGVEMAALQMKYGTDPILNRLAWNIFVSQPQEIMVMERWLEERGENRE